MDSSGHRKNILGKSWEVIGVGAYKGADGKKMWTVLFADKCGSSAAEGDAQADRQAQAEAGGQGGREGRHRSRPPKPTPRPTPTPKPTPVADRRDRSSTERSAGRAGAIGVAAAGSPGDARAARARAACGWSPTPAPPGLLESIVGTVTGAFFGA